MTSRPDFSTRVARRFGEAARQYDDEALAQRRAAQVLLDGLTVRGQVLDIGCGTGWLTRQLAGQGAGRVYALDLAAPMLAAPALRHPRICPVQANGACLPFAGRSMDLVVSNFALHWLPDPGQAAHELNRVLAPAGGYALAIPVAGTLAELNQAWAGVDAGRHTLAFASAARWLDALAAAGLPPLVWRQQAFYQFYPTVAALLKSIKAIGASELEQRREGLWGRGRLRALEQAMEPFRQAQGLPLRYEVLLGWR